MHDQPRQHADREGAVLRVGAADAVDPRREHVDEDVVLAPDLPFRESGVVALHAVPLGDHALDVAPVVQQLALQAARLVHDDERLHRVGDEGERVILDLRGAELPRVREAGVGAEARVPHLHHRLELGAQRRA